MARHNGKHISYLRVSTTKQGQSGLGLEAQRAAVETWLNGGDWELIDEVIEIESGKSHRNRPGLIKALEACRRYGAKLIINSPRSSEPRPGVPLELAGRRHRLRRGRHAERQPDDRRRHGAGGEQEREAISTRTKAALAAARARGVKLGNPRPETAAFHDRAAASIAGVGAENRATAANDFAKLIRPLLDNELAGLSANAAAAELNRRGVQTARGGGKWTARAVLNLKARRTAP